ncbi:MAG TPA: rRNA biogenesis protein rrp5 [Ruminococcus flavefaciens]|nr:rRNA biogenesis protein rrp5 [Ruminococcus flavefaciens]
MSQIKLLLDIISDVRSLGNSLQAYADALTASKVIGDLNDYEEIGTSSETPKQTEEPVQEEKPIDRSEVRAKLAELTRLGFSDEVKALLQKHGAERLSAVDDVELPALMKEAEALGSKA